SWRCSSPCGCSIFPTHIWHYCSSRLPRIPSSLSCRFSNWSVGLLCGGGFTTESLTQSVLNPPPHAATSTIGRELFGDQTGFGSRTVALAVQWRTHAHDQPRADSSQDGGADHMERDQNDG